MSSRDLMKQLTRLLEPLLETERDRQYWLAAALADLPRLRSGIDWGGAPAIFTQQLVHTLLKGYGSAGHTGLVNLLDDVAEQRGEEAAATIGPLREAVLALDAGTFAAPKPGTGVPPTSPEAGQPRAFLCHAVEDKPKVRELYRRLKADGFVPWLDEEDLLPGQDWRLAIRQALRASDFVLVCLSRTAVSKRGFVQKEVADALDLAQELPEGAVLVVPVRLEECPLPERLSHLHCADLFRPDGYERLCRTLRGEQQHGAAFWYADFQSARRPQGRRKGSGTAPEGGLGGVPGTSRSDAEFGWWDFRGLSGYSP
jgi:hypothetical protein